MKTRVTLFLVFILTAPLFAQRDHWQVKFMDGSALADISLKALAGDSLTLVQGERERRFSVDALAELRHKGKGNFWKGAGYGFLAGAAAGAIIGRMTYKEPDANDGEFSFDFGPEANMVGGGIIGGLLGLAIGGSTSANNGPEQVYELSQKSRAEKIATLQTLLDK